MGFFTKMRKGLIDTFGNVRLYSGGMIFWGKSGYRIDGPDQRSILDVIRPGDILLRRYTHYVGSMLTPGYWSHCALYIGDNNDIIHAAGGGVNTTDILTFMRTDSLALVRCDDVDLLPAAIAYAKEKLAAQVPYDYDFKAENDALYCSELIWEAFDRPACTKYHNKYIVPDDILSITSFKMLIEIKK